MGRAKRDVNLLELVPRRLVEHETDESGIVTVLMPRFRNRVAKLFFEPRYKSPHIRIKLDEIGSATWALIDGRRNVGAIAGTLREKFGEKIEPCHERLGKFFLQLERGSFIEYVNFEEIKARG